MFIKLQFWHVLSADETAPQDVEVAPEQTGEPGEGAPSTDQQKTPEPGNNLTEISICYSHLLQFKIINVSHRFDRTSNHSIVLFSIFVYTEIKKKKLSIAAINKLAFW